MLLLTGVFFYILTVAVQHYRVWKSAPSNSGVLPFHVWVISSSHALAILGLGIVEFERQDQALDIISLLTFLSSILAVVALSVLRSVQASRARASRTMRAYR